MYNDVGARNHSAQGHFFKSVGAPTSLSLTTTPTTIAEAVTTLAANARYALADVANSPSATDLMMWSSAEYFADALPQQQHHVLYLCGYCKMVAIVLYTLLSVIAFFGNSLILAAFFFIRRLRTPTNMLIANLAVADLMISVFCIPLSYWHVIIFEDQRWIFGAFLCKIFNYLQATAVFLSSWTLVAISFDRFMAIWFVMSPWLRINRRKAFYVIIATWAFSLTMALPLLIVNKVEVTRTGVGATHRLVQTCQEKWELVRGFLIFGNDEAPVVHAYTLLVFALQYCLPLLVLLVTYTFIGLRMWNSKVPGEPTSQFISNQTWSTCGGVVGVTGANSNVSGVTSGGSAIINQQKSVHAQERRHESVKKLIPMVLLVSALYAGCWLPQNVLMNIWISYDPTITSHPYILYIWWGSHTLAMFHSVVNPFIYYYQNKRIHEALNYLLSYLPCVHTNHVHTPLIAIHFNDDNNTTTTGLGVGAGGFASHKSSNSGADGVRIVNMVAYMSVTGGKRVQPHPNDANNTAALYNNNNNNNRDKISPTRIDANHCSIISGEHTTFIAGRLPAGNKSRNNIINNDNNFRTNSSNAIGSYAGSRRLTDRDVW